MYIDWSNTLYIADTGNHRVQRYSKDASYGETVAGQASGKNGSNLNELNHPRDVFVTLNGDIYVTDSDNHRIQLWTQGSLNGTTVAGVTG